MLATLANTGFWIYSPPPEMQIRFNTRTIFTETAQAVSVLPCPYGHGERRPDDVLALDGRNVR
jgi:hypothetical protein